MKQFNISNNLISKLNLNITNILITTKCPAGYLTNDTITFNNKTQLFSLPSRYKTKSIYGISVIINNNDHNYIINILNCYPNGNVANMCGDYLLNIPNNELRYAFKNAEELIAFKTFHLEKAIEKIEDSYK
jgi:hypothetical protein